jgi:hypothetical protein
MKLTWVFKTCSIRALVRKSSAVYALPSLKKALLLGHATWMPALTSCTCFTEGPRPRAWEGLPTDSGPDSMGCQGVCPVDRAKEPQAACNSSVMCNLNMKEQRTSSGFAHSAQFDSLKQLTNCKAASMRWREIQGSPFDRNGSPICTSNAQKRKRLDRERPMQCRRCGAVGGRGLYRS